jgi:nicotinate phosphoribosyltransferase
MERHEGPATPPGMGRADASALYVDLYELTMAQAYLGAGVAEHQATFSLFARRLPSRWGYLVAAGLGELCALLAELRFTDEELAFLESTKRFNAELLARLGAWRFTGRVRALPEGTPFGAHTPVVEIDAPLIEAQLIETLVLNIVHVQSLMASKASRVVAAASGRDVVDFSMRRDHGTSAGMAMARAGHIAGLAATSNVLAGARYGIPIAGTMAHSMVQAFPDEAAAFRSFARAYPADAILLVDTYDTAAGVRRAIEVGAELRRAGHQLRGIRLDSGDLAGLAREARVLLDEAGEDNAIIFASGGLDEDRIAALLAEGAPIDGFGVGSYMGTVRDAPALDMAYKLVQIDGRPTLKLSRGKATLPGPKQVWRRRAGDLVIEDVVGQADELGPPDGSPLLAVAMEDGHPGGFGCEPLEHARRRRARALSELSPEQLGLDADPLPARISPRLDGVCELVAAELRRRHGLDAPR